MLKVLKDEGNLKNLLTNKKIVVLYFTANWCMPCRKMYEPLEDLSIKYKDIFLQAEKEYSTYNFEYANTDFLLKNFEIAESECKFLLE